MKRRTVQKRALAKEDQRPAPPMAPTQEIPVPEFLPHPDPIPRSLARWTGNLLYWVGSIGAQYYADVVAPLGLSPSQVAVLQVLADEGMMRQARLTDRTRIDKATMVGLLNELERQECIERRPSPNDKRAFDIYLTEKGEQQVRRVEEVSQKAEDEFYKALSPQERQDLRDLLLRLIHQPAETSKQ